jgi:hypothetical protein
MSCRQTWRISFLKTFVLQRTWHQTLIWNYGRSCLLWGRGSQEGICRSYVGSPPSPVVQHVVKLNVSDFHLKFRRRFLIVTVKRILEESYFCGVHIEGIKTVLKFSEIINDNLCKCKWKCCLIFELERFTVSGTVFGNLGFVKQKFLSERFHLRVHIAEEPIFPLQSYTVIIHV